MKKFVLRSLVVAVIAAGSFAATGAAMAADAGNLAVVNGKAIPMAQYDQIIKQFQQSGQPVTDAMKDRLKKELIKREVLLQAAQKAGVESTAEYASDLDNAKNAIAINLLMKTEMAKIQVSDADAKAEYDKFAKSNGGKEYEADHILVKTEAEAKDIIAKLNKDKGANFAALAKKFSQDPGSASKGGSLGWAAPSNYVPAFSTALEALKKGQWSQEPVKTQFGYHIIKLDDTRATPLPKFDDVKTQIVQQLKQQKITQLQDQLVKEAKIQ